MTNKDTSKEFVHLVGLLIYILQYNAQCIQCQKDGTQFLSTNHLRTVICKSKLLSNDQYQSQIVFPLIIAIS
jgi:hypothetical protein